MKATAWRILPLLLATTALGCPFAMYTKPYEPPDADEARALAAARRDVFPRDVREDPSLRDTVISWAGIVRGASPNEAGRGSVLVIAEHHYFDWLKDHGAQTEVFFLSPRGEGMFRIEIGPGDDLFDQVQSNPTLLVGLMVVVIGRPGEPVSARPDEPIPILHDHVRFIRAQVVPHRCIRLWPSGRAPEAGRESLGAVSPGGVGRGHPRREGAHDRALARGDHDLAREQSRGRGQPGRAARLAGRGAGAAELRPTFSTG